MVSLYSREYQGLRPPVERTEEQFDAGAKYHVPANVEYLRWNSSKACFRFIFIFIGLTLF